MRLEAESKFNLIWFASLLMVTFILSGCGFGRTKTNNIQQPSPNQQPAPITFPDDGDGEPIAISFAINGPLGITPQQSFVVNTDSILRLRVISGPAQEVTVPGVSYTASYGCVQYSITVNGRTADTVILAVEGEDNSNCPSAPTSYLMDFSDRLGGPNPPTITVSHARYDFYCELWYAGQIAGPFNLYCPVRPAYKTHTLSGNLIVQVNGTMAP